MSGRGWRLRRPPRPSRAITRLIVAAALLSAAARVSAQPSVVALANGLDVAVEAGGPYDAVVACFVTPEPEALDEIGRRAVVVAALTAAAREPGGPADRVARVGGAIAVEEAGDLIVVTAYGDSGSAPTLARQTVDLLRHKSGAASLMGDGSLPAEIDRSVSAGLSLRGEAERRLLGAAWCADPAEIRLAAESLTPGLLDAIMDAWFSASGGAVSVVSAGAVAGVLGPLSELSQAAGAGKRLVRTAGRGDAVVRTQPHGQSVVAVAVAGPLPIADDAPAWAVTARLLGAGNSSALFRELRTAAGLAYLTGCSWPIDESCLLWAEAECDPGRERDVLAGMEGILDELARTGPTREALDRAKARTRLQLLAALSSPLRRARLRAAGMAWGDGPLWPERLTEKIEGVAPEDIRRVAETIASGGLVLRIESGPG